jgi:SAM-dependent methyltransferase
MDTPTAAAPSLRDRYERRSKHSSYQQVHPMLARAFGNTDGLPPGKRETQRQRYFDRVLRYEGASLLDIGANTGYFSFAAVERGARRVCCYEGNAEHAAFLADGAGLLGLQDRVEVRPRYFEFDGRGERFDIVLCLNVLHHLGDDFGDPALGMEDARRRMLACLRNLAANARTLVLQIGFNWKGDVRHPLFEGGRKAPLIEFVRSGLGDAWDLQETVVANPETGEYEPAGEHNLGRYDALGEFMNRPIFLLKAR